MLAWLIANTSAWACGGLFCDSYGTVTAFAPTVVQQSEDIVFAVDEVAGTVETHVRIAYDGAPEEFGWVVPVPTVPELFVSTDTLFDVLTTQLRRQPTVMVEGRSECGGAFGDADADSDADADADSDADMDADASGVIIASAGRVGPYETTVLTATSEAVLVDWLDEQGYDLPPSFSTALGPYVASGSWLVAMKLAPGVTTGALAPIGMRYTSTSPSIPIQLTAVATASTLPIAVTVLGSARAVPVSYLHLTVNDVMMDWERGGLEWPTQVRQAAQAAGGHGFVTEGADAIGTQLAALVPSDFDTDPLRTLGDPVVWLNEVYMMGVPTDQALLDVLRTHMPIDRAYGVSDTLVYASPYYFAYAFQGMSFDPAAATDDLVEYVTDPLDHASELLASHAWATRMLGSMAASEMTVDPTFTLAPALPAVSPTPTMRVKYLCSPAWDSSTVIRQLTMPDGRVALLPPTAWLAQAGLTLPEFLAQWSHPPSSLVESMDGNGVGTVQFALTTADPSLEDMNAFVSLLGPTGPHATPQPPEPEGPTWFLAEASECGCDSARGGTAWALGLWALARRRGRAVSR